MICPKCGYEQVDGGVDCARCGVVFARYKPVAGTLAPDWAAPPPAPSRTAGRAAPHGGSGGGTSYGGGGGTLYGGEGGPGGPGGDGGRHGDVAAGPARQPAAWIAAPAPARETTYGGPLPTSEGAGVGGGPGGPGGVGGVGGGGGQADGPAAVGMAMRQEAGRGGAGGLGGGGGGTTFGGFAAGGRLSIRPEVTAGEVLSDTFRIFFSNLVPFLLISILVNLPLAVGTIRLAEGGVSPGLVVLSLLLVAVLGTPLVTSAVTYGVAQELKHREVSIVDCLRIGLSSFLSVLGIAILQGLAVSGGLILCIVPGLIAMVALSVAVPAALEERDGVLASLRRSVDLTEGHRWMIFGVLLVLGLLQAGLDRLVLLAQPAHASVVGLQIPAALVRTFTTALQATAAAVLYYRLRGRVEGVGVESIASVFD